MSLTMIIVIVVGAVVLLFLGGLAVVNYSNDELMDRFNKVSTIDAGITPVEFASFISEQYFDGKVDIRQKNGVMCDCFSSDFSLTLSSEYANRQHLAGLSICCHELGHAFQFKNNFARMKKWAKKIKTSKILSKFTFPFLIFGIVSLFFNYILSLMFGGFALVTFFVALSVKLSTIRLEKEASQIGLSLLQKHTNLSVSEINTAKQFLNSAKQTYVADFLKTMLKWTGLTRK